MSIANELSEAVRGGGGYAMPPKEKKSINDLLRKAGMDGNGRFRSVSEAISKASEVLNANGFEWGQVTSADLFRPPKGHQTILIAKRTDDPFSPIEVANTALSFQYTELRPHTYEVVAYLG